MEWCRTGSVPKRCVAEWHGVELNREEAERKGYEPLGKGTALISAAWERQGVAWIRDGEEKNRKDMIRRRSISGAA
ncbi:MAG: hypothetical protein GY847_01735 [Proteobacteria bacterium]|nr:hypothetical protein [Pseudomonadota bacterium]